MKEIRLRWPKGRMKIYEEHLVTTSYKILVYLEEKARYASLQALAKIMTKDIHNDLSN